MLIPVSGAGPSGFWSHSMIATVGSQFDASVIAAVNGGIGGEATSVQALSAVTTSTPYNIRIMTMVPRRAGGAHGSIREERLARNESRHMVPSSAFVLASRQTERH